MLLIVNSFILIDKNNILIDKKSLYVSALCFSLCKNLIIIERCSVMKKYLCFIFVIFLVSLLVWGNKRSFENAIVCADINYNVLDNNIIEISNDEVEIFLEKMNVQILNKFEVSDRLIIEGYTNKIANYVLVNNCKINIQLSIADNMVIIGSPLINGSF